MRALVQRVTQARVRVDDRVVGEIGPGLCRLIAATPSDDGLDTLMLQVWADDLRVAGG